MDTFEIDEACLVTIGSNSPPSQIWFGKQSCTAEGN